MGGETIPVDFNTAAALRELEALNKRVDDLAAKAKGLTLGGVASSVAHSGLGGSTGQAIASFAASSPLDKILTIVEQIGATYFPQIMSKLDVLAPRQAAFSQVSAVAEQGARLGITLPSSAIDRMRDQSIAAETRAQEARYRVRSAFGKEAISSAQESMSDAMDRLDFDEWLENLFKPRNK